MHVYPLFIKPKELKRLLAKKNLFIEKILGFRPKILSKAFFSMILKKEVPDAYHFTFCKSIVKTNSNIFF